MHSANSMWCGLKRSSSVKVPLLSVGACEVFSDQQGGILRISADCWIDKQKVGTQHPAQIVGYVPLTSLLVGWKCGQ